MRRSDAEFTKWELNPVQCTHQRSFALLCLARCVHLRSEHDAFAISIPFGFRFDKNLSFYDVIWCTYSLWWVLLAAAFCVAGHCCSFYRLSLSRAPLFIVLNALGCSGLLSTHTHYSVASLIAFGYLLMRKMVMLATENDDKDDDDHDNIGEVGRQHGGDKTMNRFHSWFFGRLHTCALRLHRQTNFHMTNVCISCDPRSCLSLLLSFDHIPIHWMHTQSAQIRLQLSLCLLCMCDITSIWFSTVHRSDCPSAWLAHEYFILKEERKRSKWGKIQPAMCAFRQPANKNQKFIRAKEKNPFGFLFRLLL